MDFLALQIWTFYIHSLASVRRDEGKHTHFIHIPKSSLTFIKNDIQVKTKHTHMQIAKSDCSAIWYLSRFSSKMSSHRIYLI